MIDMQPLSKSKFWKLRNDARVRPQPWRWPLQQVGDREPIVLAERVEGRRGIDLGYAPLPQDHEVSVPVFAAQDGEIMLAGETASGCFVSMNHDDGHASYYGQMSKLVVSTNYRPNKLRRQRVRGGDVIGYAAKSPIQIRFELWRWTDRDGYVSVDPIATLDQLIPKTSASTLERAA